MQVASPARRPAASSRRQPTLPAAHVGPVSPAAPTPAPPTRGMPMASRVIYTATVTGFPARGVCCANCVEESLFDVRRDAAATAVGGTGVDPHARFRASDQAHQKLSRELHSAED